MNARGEEGEEMIIIGKYVIGYSYELDALAHNLKVEGRSFHDAIKDRVFLIADKTEDYNKLLDYVKEKSNEYMGKDSVSL